MLSVTLCSGGTLVALAFLFGGKWVALLTSAAILALLIGGLHVVPQNHAAIIFSRWGFFRRVCNEGVAFIVPFFEQIAFFIDLNMRLKNFAVNDVHTRDKIAVSIRVSVLFGLDPHSIEPSLAPVLVRLLPRWSEFILQRWVDYGLRNLICVCDITALFESDRRGRIERQLTESVRTRVGRLGILIPGTILLGEITLPNSLQNEFNDAQNTCINAQARAGVLQILQGAVASLSAEDLERILDIETVNALAQNGVHPLMMSLSDIRGRSGNASMEVLRQVWSGSGSGDGDGTEP